MLYLALVDDGGVLPFLWVMDGLAGRPGWDNQQKLQSSPAAVHDDLPGSSRRSSATSIGENQRRRSSRRSSATGTGENQRLSTGLPAKGAFFRLKSTEKGPFSEKTNYRIMRKKGQFQQVSRAINSPPHTLYSESRFVSGMQRGHFWPFFPGNWPGPRN